MTFFWIPIFLFIPFNFIVGDQRVLLDTTKETILDWTRYPFGASAPTPGWVEESFTNFDKGINWRTYVVCDVGCSDVNNWLWTPFINRKDANRIYIETKFSVRNCKLFPGRAVQCKETFSLLYYEFDAVTEEPPPWKPESYKLIDRIAADEGRVTENSEIIINTETRSIDVKKKGVYFAIRDQGACISLLAVKVYYLTCPNTIVGFAEYPETHTGSEISSIVRVEGKCVKNAVPLSKENKPSNICQSDGSWSYHDGECGCNAGYSPDFTTQSCEPCSVGYYKSELGQSSCQLCSPQSSALYVGSVECKCHEGYFKGTDNVTCSKPPHSSSASLSSPPRNLKYQFLNKNTLHLTWDAPHLRGNNPQYRLTCIKSCSPQLTYSHSNDFSESQILISQLQEDKSYTFVVEVIDSFSSSSSSNSASLTIPPRFHNSSSSSSSSDSSTLVVIIEKVISPSKILLSWSSDLRDIEAFQVKYFIEGQKQNSSNIFLTNKGQAEIGDLLENVNYGFQVRAKTSGHGWSLFSSPIYRRSVSDEIRLFGDASKESENSSSSSSSSSSTEEWNVAIGAVLSLIAIVICILTLLFIIRRHRLPAALKKRFIHDMDEDYRGLDYPSNIMGRDHGIVITHKLPTQYHKTYVDPHTYEDPNLAVRQFAKEIDSQFITIEAIIGGGEFGDVCRGRLSHSDRNEMMVAIKTLKSGSSDKARADFLTEASIMGQFEHPNVIFLQGVVTKTNPIMIITEFMENGSLDTFLRANDGKFQMMQLVGMMRGIAYGMQYLAEMNYVHRDLAARNVLVNSQLVCKIADFGLSREVTDGNGLDAGAYTTRGGKIPVRWTAPEAIAFRKFTSSSDVWSFGIVMWEVMSYGERPYWTWSNQDVIKAIEKGYRLPPPMDCPEAIHQLMLDSWQKERCHRPGFVSIVKTLDKLICCPETLRKIANSPFQNPFLGSIDYSAFTGVEAWLASLKMNRYYDNFASHGIVCMSDVAKLTLQKLIDLGITLVGHQKKIMGSIHAMRAQLSVNMSEGFLV